MSARKPITILYFASARTLLGISTESVSVPDGSNSLPLSSLADLLASKHPQRADELRKVLASSKWSVDQEMIDEDQVASTTLRGGEEVAVIPPTKENQDLPVVTVPSEPKVKPVPTPAGLRTYAARQPISTSPLVPSHFSYSPAPLAVESNLLIFFHGLGDTLHPFATLGRSLQKALPQTAILSIQASKRVPFLDEGEEAWMWWDTFDGLGEVLTKPNPTATVSGIRTLLEYLAAPKEEGGCAWPSSAIHLFGFGQGGSVALESAIEFAKARRRLQQTDAPPGSAPTPKLLEVGSVVSVCAGLVSHPTLQPALSTPVLYLHRSPSTPASTIASLRKATKGLNIEKLEAISLPGGEVATEAMPRNQREWDPIMQFWSRILRNRSRLELDGELLSVA